MKHSSNNTTLSVSILEFLKVTLLVLSSFIKSIIANKKSYAKLNMEIIALKSQLTLYEQEVINHKRVKKRPDGLFRLLWMFLSKYFKDWKSSLIVIKPETVVRWHRQAFKIYWRKKSRTTGRPTISRQTIMLIKQIHRENPLLSPEKIHEQLIYQAVVDAPCANTIRKYLKMEKSKRPPTDKQLQSWKSFLKNHNLWAMDLFVVPTINFQILYGLVIICHKRRRIEHIAVTKAPTAQWVAQQIRNATPFGKQPKYLLHDNDTIFSSAHFQQFLRNTNIKSVRTSYKSPWQNGICERVIRTLRQECTNHIIPLNEAHLCRILREYVAYYNQHRTHQSINCETPDAKPRPKPTRVIDTHFEAKKVLGGLYHSYEKVA